MRHNKEYSYADINPFVYIFDLFNHDLTQTTVALVIKIKITKDI